MKLNFRAARYFIWKLELASNILWAIVVNAYKKDSHVKTDKQLL